MSALHGDMSLVEQVREKSNGKFLLPLLTALRAHRALGSLSSRPVADPLDFSVSSIASRLPIDIIYAILEAISTFPQRKRPTPTSPSLSSRPPGANRPSFTSFADLSFLLHHSPMHQVDSDTPSTPTRASYSSKKPSKLTLTSPPRSNPSRSGSGQPPSNEKQHATDGSRRVSPSRSCNSVPRFAPTFASSAGQESFGSTRPRRRRRYDA